MCCFVGKSDTCREGWRTLQISYRRLSLGGLKSCMKPLKNPRVPFFALFGDLSLIESHLPPCKNDSSLMHVIVMGQHEGTTLETRVVTTHPNKLFVIDFLAQVQFFPVVPLLGRQIVHLYITHSSWESLCQLLYIPIMHWKQLPVNGNSLYYRPRQKWAWHFQAYVHSFQRFYLAKTFP